MAQLKIFLVLFVTGKSEAAGGVLESGLQGSTTVAVSDLEDQRPLSFNKECSSSMSFMHPRLIQLVVCWP